MQCIWLFGTMWGETPVQGLENDLGSESLLFCPRPKVGERKATQRDVFITIQWLWPGNTETPPLFSSTQKPCPWRSHLQFPWTPILATLAATASTTSPSILAPHSLMWSLSSQLPEPYLFTPCGIHHFLSCMNYVCTWPICILLTSLKHRHLSIFSPLLPPNPQCLKQWLPEGQQVVTSRLLLGEPSS